MSITARIKQKSIFKKTIIMEELINLIGLSYGVSDENYRLNREEIGAHTLIYDETKLARGLELWIDDKDVLLSLSLPTSPFEIRLYYQIIEKICRQFHTKKYLRNDEEASIHKNEEYIKWDEEASITALEELTNKTMDLYRHFEIFGIYNPISLGPNELKQINNNLKNFEEYLHEIQSLDVYYAAPKVFRKKDIDTLFGVYSVVAEIPCVVPLKPYIVLNQIEGVEDWYVMVQKGITIAYDDFINNASSKQYYDANHVIVLLSKNEVEALIRQYSVQI